GIVGQWKVEWSMSLTLARRLANSQPWLDRLADRLQPVVRDLLGRSRRVQICSTGPGWVRRCIPR
ncbi:MAG: hypothetical protein ACRDRL_24335, partial [Sciscionella sp.]